MKKTLYLISLILLSKSGFSQELNITGSIKDSANNPLSMASVTIEKTKQGIAADATGHFSLSAVIGTKILVSAIGYKDTLVTIKSNEPLAIVLRAAENQLKDVTVTDTKFNSLANNQVKNDVLQAEFLHYKMENNISSSGIHVYENIGYHIVNTASTGNLYLGSAIPEFHSKEDTKGSIYLYKDWMKGVVANPNDSGIIDDPKNLYNLNKSTGVLTMTRDFKSALSVDKDKVVFFILFDSLGNPHTFLRVYTINDKLFCEAISLGDNYSIYKLTTTKFVKANFHSNGISSTGNNYDEYVDTESYYLMNVNDGVATKFELKKKALKQLFTMPKAVGYFAEHTSDELNDSFLRDLGKAIN